MAHYKMNHLQLYVEHVYEFEETKDLIEKTGYISSAELKELDAYCKENFIDFVPSLSTFGHLYELLEQPQYKHLRVLKDYETAPNFWHNRMAHHTLDPESPQSIALVESLIDQYISCFDSEWFNICCDETFDLKNGKHQDMDTGELYIAFTNKLINYVKSYGKQVMMWGDIIAKNPAMINHLPKDIQFIVWSYVDADSFNNHIDPIAQSGHPFWVASGMSMWSTVFPLVDVYIKNIANLIRDGYIAGAKGVMNTAWDDSGESLFNSAWHGMAWTAEMAWKPIYNTSVSLADSERRDREETFNKVFNIQYFRTKQSIVPLLYSIGNMSTHADIGSRVNTGTLNEPLLDFYPSKVGDEVIESSKKVMEITKRLSNKCKEIINDTTIANRDIFLNAKYAADRVGATAQKNMLRALLYKVYVSPTTDNIAEAKQCTDSLLRTLQMLKYSYLNLWDYECRQYSRDIITDRYDHFANELLDLENHVFISTQLSTEGKPVVSLRTLYNDRPIYYTADGGKPSKATKIYVPALRLDKSIVEFTEDAL